MKLREDYSFHELVKTPDLACEVTMQPIRRYGMDAAIIFADILVIPEALGQEYGFRETGGIEMAFRVQNKADVDKLEVGAVRERLQYVPDALKLVREELGEDRALIGFGGSPWTLATYMVEGGSSRDYRFAKQMYFQERELFDQLMEKIVEASIEYFRMQVEAGVDVIQIFDSWGGVLGPYDFEDASSKWMAQIIDAIDDVPFIVFPKGGHEHVGALQRTGADVVGVSWTADLRAVKDALGEGIAVQGNLDPIVIETTPEITRRETRRILDAMEGVDGHVFNLGHGVSPHGRIDCIEAMIDEIRNG
jgi:uroporphyrinogen decarboxylase